MKGCESTHLPYAALVCLPVPKGKGHLLHRILRHGLRVPFLTEYHVGQPSIRTPCCRFLTLPERVRQGWRSETEGEAESEAEGEAEGEAGDEAKNSTTVPEEPAELKRIALYIT